MLKIYAAVSALPDLPGLELGAADRVVAAGDEVGAVVEPGHRVAVPRGRHDHRVVRPGVGRAVVDHDVVAHHVAVAAAEDDRLLEGREGRDRAVLARDRHGGDGDEGEARVAGRIRQGTRERVLEVEQLDELDGPTEVAAVATGDEQVGGTVDGGVDRVRERRRHGRDHERLTRGEHVVGGLHLPGPRDVGLGQLGGVVVDGVRVADVVVAPEHHGVRGEDAGPGHVAEVVLGVRTPHAHLRQAQEPDVAGSRPRVGRGVVLPGVVGVVAERVVVARRDQDVAVVQQPGRVLGVQVDGRVGRRDVGVGDRIVDHRLGRPAVEVAVPEHPAVVEDGGRNVVRRAALGRSALGRVGPQAGHRIERLGRTDDAVTAVHVDPSVLQEDGVVEGVGVLRHAAVVEVAGRDDGTGVRDGDDNQAEQQADSLQLFWWG